MGTASELDAVVAGAALAGAGADTRARTTLHQQQAAQRQQPPQPGQQQHHHSAGTTMALDLVAGTAAGTAQLLVGHPFDTIKVKLQSQSAAGARFKGPLDAARQTVTQEGLRGLYRGAAAGAA